MFCRYRSHFRVYYNISYAIYRDTEKRTDINIALHFTQATASFLHLAPEAVRDKSSPFPSKAATQLFLSYLEAFLILKLMIFTNP